MSTLRGTREAAWRVVIGDLSPTTTTLSARYKLDHDVHDEYGMHGGRQRLDGRRRGSRDDLSRRPLRCVCGWQRVEGR